MKYGTLLAHVSNESTAASVLRVASILADKYSAHLIALHIQPPIEMYVTEVTMPIDLTTTYEKEQAGIESRVRATFEKMTLAQSYVAEWRKVSLGVQSISDAVAEYANTVDMLIIGQSEERNADSRFRKVTEHVLMTSGRPGVIIPDQYELASLGQRILLAWNGSGESTRAVFNALPLLQDAEEVRLHRINPPHQDKHHFSGITDELARTLARHDVNVKLQNSDTHAREVGEEILGCANDMAADLIVMGCYGHSRLREFVLGSTTQRVLREATVPLLMSN